MIGEACGDFRRDLLPQVRDVQKHVPPSEILDLKLAEGVGFEPTVGYPTLDFESSALNRTQPPFQRFLSI
jgi:hypothetical protein